MTTPSDLTIGQRIRRLSELVVRTEPTRVGTDVAALAVRIALVWIFVYYGAGKLFGAFNGPGLHATALFMSTTAHLHPGGFFAVLGGVIEFGGAVALAFGFMSRLAALALVGDQVMAMITVTWAHGINSLTTTPGYEFNLALVAMALVVVGIGGGRLSVDAVIGRQLRASAVAGDHGYRPEPPRVRKVSPAPLATASPTTPTGSGGGGGVGSGTVSTEPLWPLWPW
jgi:putative oxidoreductase